MSESNIVPQNALLCLTNCFLPEEDGSLVKKDLWIDEQRGIILDPHASTLQYMSCRELTSTR